MGEYMKRSEYISREAAIKAVCDCSAHTCKMGECFNSCNEAKALSSIPADDVVEVVRGKWEMNSNYPDRFICSECGAQFDCWHWEAKQMHYCPSCGAKMDGGQDDV